MRSISAGRYEVTSRPTSCSRTAGLVQVFMGSSSYRSASCFFVGAPAKGPPEAVSFIGGLNLRIELSLSSAIALTEPNHIEAFERSNSASRVRVSRRV